MEREPTQEECKQILKDHSDSYQEDLVRYTNEIKHLKKDNINKQKIFSLSNQSSNY